MLISMEVVVSATQLGSRLFGLHRYRSGLTLLVGLERRDSTRGNG